MKAFLLILLGAPALLLAQTTTPAVTPDAAAPGPKLTAEQAASVLKQLDDIEGKFNKSRGDTLSVALARCKTASSSEKDALELYVACYKTEHFDKLNLKQADFQEWRQRNDERFRDPVFLGAVLLQVRFLTLAIQAQDAKDKDMPGLIAGLQGVINDTIRLVGSTVIHTTAGAVKENDKGKKPATKGQGGRSFDSAQLVKRLQESVKESEFCKAFELEDFLVREDWGYIPLDIASIYDQAILPYYLQAKPSELSAQWDQRIKSRLALKQALSTDIEYQVYYRDHYPEMLWDKAKYLLDNNVNPTLALADMLKIIRNNPGHPKAGEWIKDLRTEVNKSQGNVPSPGLSEAATTPAK